MASFIQKISIALIVSLAICSASPARLDRLRSNKSKFLARQEVAEDIPAAQTPYPPAGIQPEVRFALPTEEELNDQPEKTYLPPAGEPAKTYGPPEASVKDEVEQFANDEPQPEETKSVEPKLEKPDAEVESSEQPEESEEEEPENQDSTDAEPAGIEAEEIEAEAVKNEEEAKSNLPARLVRARNNRQKSAKLQIATPQQIAQPIYYFNYNGQIYRILN